MNTRQKFNLRPVRVMGVAAGLVLLAGLEGASAQTPDRAGDTAASAIKTNEGQNRDSVVPAQPASPAHPRSAPIVPEKKKQARLLGVLGLVICSVLALATGLALLRSLRQR